jgi:putative DNA primase/helicase
MSEDNTAIVQALAAGFGLGAMQEYDDDDMTVKRDEKQDTSAAKEGGGGLSDAVLADRVADDVLAGQFCWSEGLGWLQWDGKRWAFVPEAAPVEAIRRYFIQWHGKAAIRESSSVTLLKALSGLLSRTKIANVLALTKGIVLKDAADFDSHHDLLNVGNGVVDLTTGTLGKHDPELLMTKLTPVNFRAGAVHQDWQAALAALPPSVADWMQVRVGQSASGHMTPDDLLVVNQGGGANGKTTIFGGVRCALGDHAVIVPERVLLTNPGDHPTELMTLLGARLALMEETPEARHLSVKRLKDTVGTQTMSARLIRGNNVTWPATHSLMLTTNYAPRIDETDHGTWRRLALVRFPYTFVDPTREALSGHERRGDPLLRDRLKDGRQGQHEAILGWIVEGARRWYANDRVMPAMPEQVRKDTAEWRSEADLIFAFIRDQLVFDPNHIIATVDLLADFNEWSAGLGGKPWGDQTFTIRFGGHSEVDTHNVTKVVTKKTAGLSRRPGNFKDVPTGQIRAWDGVRFRTSADDEEKPEPRCSEHELTGLTGSTGTPHENQNLLVTKPPCQPCQLGSDEVLDLQASEADFDPGEVLDFAEPEDPQQADTDCLDCGYPLPDALIADDIHYHVGCAA